MAQSWKGTEHDRAYGPGGMSVDLFGVETAPSRQTAQGYIGKGKGAHDEWLTPPEVVKALGPFDLDPCSPINRPWDTAAKHYTVANDGLRQPWAGFVWLNPPYGNWSRWLHKLADHGDGIALIFARTETRHFFDTVWDRADSLLFLRGRLNFHYSDGRRAPANSGAPSVFVGYGERASERLASGALDGRFVLLDRSAA